MKTLAYGFLGIAALMSADAFATGALPNGPYIVASGSASSDVAPDYAIFNFAIDGEGPKTSDASAAADKVAAKLFTILKAAGVAQSDIRASDLSVQPDYDYEDNSNKRVYKGQLVSRGFKVTLRDLSKFSALTQSLLDADLPITGVEFGSSRETEMAKQNLDAAIADARKRADDMAAQAGEHVERIYGLVPSQMSSFISQEFPFMGNFAWSGMGKIEVTGTRVARSDTYVVPKSITFSSSVTIVCTVK